MSIILKLVEAIQLAFFVRALVAGCVLAVTCSLMGNFVILRREANSSHAIAEMALLGVAISMLISIPIHIGVLVACIFAVVVILYFQSRSSLTSDSIMELVAQVALAAAVLVLSQMHGYRSDPSVFLFGHILGITLEDVIITTFICLSVFVVFLRFKNTFMQAIFNEDLAISLGVNTKIMNVIFMMLLGLLIAQGVQLVGVLLLSSFLIIPSNTAKIFATSFRQMLAYSVFLGVFTTIIGLFISYIFDAPSGAVIILVMGSGLLLAQVLKRFLKH
ncbi:MAG: metal ABC transporter permease [bacterium]